MGEKKRNKNSGATDIIISVPGTFRRIKCSMIFVKIYDRPVEKMFHFPGNTSPTFVGKMPHEKKGYLDQI